MESITAIDGNLLVLIGVVLVVQVTLQVMALVQLVRTPADRVTIGGRKWAWGIIILLGEIVGPILWFLVGKRPAEVHEASAPAAEDERRSAVDSLYGTPKE